MVTGASSIAIIRDRGAPSAWIEDIGLSFPARRFSSASIAGQCRR
jgi:hypothetical protein